MTPAGPVDGPSWPESLTAAPRSGAFADAPSGAACGGGLPRTCDTPASTRSVRAANSSASASCPRTRSTRGTELSSGRPSGPSAGTSIALCRAYTPGAGSGVRVAPAATRASARSFWPTRGREPLPVRQDEGAERRRDQQGADDLEREHVLAEDDVRDAGRVVVASPRRSARTACRRSARPTTPTSTTPSPMPASSPIQRCPRMVSTSESDAVDADEHEDEQEEHHHGAGVDDHLDDPEEHRVLRDVEERQRDHHDDHGERGVHGLLGEQQRRARRAP